MNKSENQGGFHNNFVLTVKSPLFKKDSLLQLKNEEALEMDLK